MKEQCKSEVIMSDYLIMNIANGFMGSYILYIACELQLFDHLNHKEKNIHQLAADLNIDGEILLKILRPLLAYGLIGVTDNNRYFLERRGAKLISSDEHSLYSYVLFCGRESIKVWDKIYPAITMNCSPKSLMANTDVFLSHKNDEQKFLVFDGMMQRISNHLNLTAFFDLYSKQTKELQIVDIGGGTGAILFKFLNYYPNSTGILVDLDFVQEQANNNIKKEGLERRCSFKVGNFFEKLDSQGDVFILSRVLHDWDDNKVIEILKNIVDQMSSKTELLIIEELLPESTKKGALEAYINDLQIWAFCGGKERTQTEFNRLLKIVGLRLKDKYCLQEGKFLHILIASKEEEGNCTEEGFI